MIIKSAVRRSLDVVGVRIDAVIHVNAASRLLRDVDDQLELDQYLGGATDPLAPIADRKFIRGDSGYNAGRYNTSAFPAFYLSRDIASSKAEIAHYNSPPKVRAALEAHSPIHLELSEWLLVASAEDLLPPPTVDNRLTQEDWAFCQAVGADAKARVDAIVYPSARLIGGANYAVYRRAVVTSKPRLGTRFELALDDSGHVAFVT